MDFTKYQKLMDDLTEEYLPCTDSAIYRGYDEILRYHTGYADREAGIPMAGDEYYFCYSVTKLFTCTAALQLFEEGKYLLNDLLCKYLPEYDPRITIRMLFTMTAGFDYDRSFAEQFAGTDTSTRDVLRELAKKPAVYVPGGNYLYSLAHDVLAVFIEVVSGERFSDYLENHIFRPLGMTHSGLYCKEPEKLAALYQHNAQTHVCERIEQKNWYRLSEQYESGGAGLVSTLDDLVKFFVTLTNGGTSKDGVCILSPATIDLMRTNFLTEAQQKSFAAQFPQYAGYGYGLGVRTFIDPLANGEPGAIGEFGWAGAAGAYIVMDPQNKLTLVFMTHVLESIDHRDTIRIKNALYSTL